MEARCNRKVASGARCWKGAAMCADHPDNASDVLKDWLTAQKIKFTVSVILCNADSSHANSDNDYYDQIRSEMSIENTVEKVHHKPYDRGSLQSGESAQMMND